VGPSGSVRCGRHSIPESVCMDTNGSKDSIVPDTYSVEPARFRWTGKEGEIRGVRGAGRSIERSRVDAVRVPLTSVTCVDAPWIRWKGKHPLIKLDIREFRMTWLV